MLLDIPPRHVGTVVTYLEMTERPRLRPMPPSALRLQHWRDPHPDRYRELFRRVGRRWLWYSRLAMDDATLAATIRDVYAVLDPRGVEVGMLELDFSQAGECLIRFLGLVPELAGKGHGKWLFAQLLVLAWRPGIARLHVNTCTLDHPAALPSYLRSGFKAYKRSFESFPDPRLNGILPAEVAPQIPLVEAGTASPRSAR